MMFELYSVLYLQCTILCTDLHGVVRHQEHILDGEGEDVGGEETGEQQPHRQLVICEVTIGADKQCVPW